MFINKKSNLTKGYSSYYMIRMCVLIPSDKFTGSIIFRITAIVELYVVADELSLSIMLFVYF